FYDIFSNPANSYFALWSSDTGDAGQNVAAYTFQFGNGFSATLAAEDPRRNAGVNASQSLGVTQGAVVQAGRQRRPNRTVFTNPFTVGATPALDQAEVKWPDIVANLRVDQVWGSFQIMGALHDASGGYYTTAAGGGLGAVTGAPTCLTGAVTGTSASLSG